MYLAASLSYSPLEVLIQTIFQKYLLTSYCITFVSDNGVELNVYPSVFTHIKVNNDSNLPECLLKVSEMGCSDYIIRVSDTENFVKVLDEVNHISTARRSDRKLIFLPIDNFNNNDLLKVLSMKEMSFIANVLLVLRNYESKNEYDCEVYKLITHKFIGVTGMENPITLDEWDSCTNTFLRHSNLFPHDMSDLKGKQLKVATFTYKPYALLDLDTNITPLGRDGFEVRLLDEFCRIVNCTIELIRNDDEQWGEIFDNRTGNGVLGNVAKDRADVGVGALYSWYHEYIFLDFAATHMRTAITCLAPSPRLLPSWELPLHPFSWWLWLAVLATFLYASIAMIIVQRGSSDRAFLTTFGMMITQTQPHVDKSWRIRVVTVWMLITGLVVDNAYGGGLASSFTVPQFEKSTDTIQDLLDSPMNWGATHDAWIFSLLLSEDPKILHLLSKFKVHDSETLHKKSFTRTMALSIEKLQAGSYAIGDYITRDSAENLEIMLEEFYWEHCVVVARKSSPYTAKISELVGRLHEAGIILAWETQVALKHLDYKVQIEVRLSRSRREGEVTSLHLNDTVGIFILYIIGAASSILLFIGEMLYHSQKNKIIIL